MASKRFRYPPAPPNGLGTFSDNLVGNQFTDGSSQMTMGNFSTPQNYSRRNSTNYNLGGFSAPITLESLNITDLELAKSLASNNLEVYINHDTSDLTNFVLYGSLNKRLKVATENIINFFPGALFVDGVDINLNTGNTTATNIIYDAGRDQTTFRVNVNYLSNPFNIEFTTNGNLITQHLSKEQIINNLEQFGHTSNTIVKIADGSVASIRNLTTEYSKYVLTFSGSVTDKEYKIINLKPQTTTTNYVELTVKGSPLGTATTTTTQYYIKPNKEESEKQFQEFGDVESFLVNRECNPIYTAKFKLLKETDQGVTYFNNEEITWPLEDAVNLDITTSSYTQYLTSLANLGDELDTQKTNLISRFLTAPVLKEFDTSGQKVEKTLQIYGRSFDDIKTFVDGIAYMTNVTYDGKNNIPNKLIKNFAKTLGWSTPSTLDNTKFLDSILGVSNPTYSGTSIGKTPAQLDVELYRRILMNTAYLFKSKGTRKSIEFMLGLLGAPQALIEFNEYVVLADSKIRLTEPLQYKFGGPEEYSAFTGTSGFGVLADNTNTGWVSPNYFRPENRFTKRWSQISGGSYVTETIKFSPVLFSMGVSPAFYISTGTTTHPFIRYTVSGGQGDYPIDEHGFPTKPRITNNYFFQRGAGWYERNEEHKSELILDEDTSILSGCTPVINNKFAPFTWGGFWTRGQYSNNLKSPYLDRFRRFPHMSFGFGLTRVIDDKKSWSQQSPGLQTRDYTFKNRDAYYQTTNEKLVLNVKNVELNLNIGQGLSYDVWRQSAQSDCFFSGGSLPSLYPNSGGTWDSTNPRWNAKLHDFKTFNQHFWKNFIDAKNRMTISDGKTGGYPTLQQMYLDYLRNNCGDNNKYTYNKMLEYAQSMGDYWVKIIEQLVPSTTLWLSGVKVQNSVFHRDKFVYRCYNMTGTTIVSALTGQFTVSPTGYTSFPAPQYQLRISETTPPTPPTVGTKYYNNILTGETPNPISSYANSYNIDNRGQLFGSKIVSEVTNLLSDRFIGNKRKYRTNSLFTKQGSINNLLCIDTLKSYEGVDSWIMNYDLNLKGDNPITPSTSGPSLTNPTRGSGNIPSTPTTASGGGGGSMGGYGGGSSGGGGGGY